MKTKRILVSVSTDLITDQRVSKVCNSLVKYGYNVTLVGRKRRASIKIEARNYKCKRLKLWFNTGFLFYANLNIRLFFCLLFTKSDALLANDLDTLPANYLASKLKSIPLIYDSHEYFTEVPELENRKQVKWVWERIEQVILPNIKFAYTVSQKIADVYFAKYGVDFKLVRNFPVYQLTKVGDKKENIVIYQGALNIGRGLEELIEAMQFLSNAKLWIVGGGNLEQELKLKAASLSLTDKIVFYGRLEPEELKELTQQAKVGVSLEKMIGLNYTFALPNKIFDYLNAGVPVLSSKLIEVGAVLNGIDIGLTLHNHEPKNIAAQLRVMLESSDYKNWVKNCDLAANKFNWEKEEQVLLSIFDVAFSN